MNYLNLCKPYVPRTLGKILQCSIKYFRTCVFIMSKIFVIWKIFLIFLRWNFFFSNSKSLFRIFKKECQKVLKSCKKFWYISRTTLCCKKFVKIAKNFATILKCQKVLQLSVVLSKKFATKRCPGFFSRTTLSCKIFWQNNA